MAKQAIRLPTGRINPVVKLLGFTAIAITGMFGGLKAIDSAIALDPIYWESRITAVKDYRQQVLDILRQYSLDGYFSPDELSKISVGLYQANQPFDFSKSSDAGLSPAQDLEDHLNRKYAFNQSSLQTRIILSTLEGNDVSVSSDIGQSVTDEMDRIENAYFDTKSHQEDIDYAASLVKKGKVLVGSLGALVCALFTTLALWTGYEYSKDRNRRWVNEFEA